MPTNIINLTNFITNTITNIVLETNIITNTNFITETNSITSWSDPTLWFTGVGAGLTVLSAFLMWCSVQEMKKQNKESNYNSKLAILYALDQEFTPIWKHYNKDWMICDYHPNIEYEKFSNSIEVETDDSVLTNILLKLAFFYEITVKSDTRLQDIFLHTFGYKFNTLIFYDKYYKPSHELIQKMINENHTYKKNTNINKK